MRYCLDDVIRRGRITRQSAASNTSVSGSAHSQIAVSWKAEPASRCNRSGIDQQIDSDTTVIGVVRPDTFGNHGPRERRFRNVGAHAQVALELPSRTHPPSATP